MSDIHGHYAEMMDLYQQMLDAGFRPDTDTLVGLGDYVDGGPETRQVIDQLMQWDEEHPHWVFLKGNHEDLMLDALVFHGRTYGDFYLWWNQGGRATARSYLPETASEYERAIMQPAEFISTSHLEWLQRRPLYYEQDGYLFVHAGFRPGYTLEAQTEQDMLWIREGFIYSDQDFYGKRVVAGHTPLEEPIVMPNKILIDTMFHDIGKLTAVELDTTDPRAEPRFFFAEATNNLS